MNTKINDRLHREIVKSIKARVELLNISTTEAERAEHLKAIDELTNQSKILTNRI
jgi:hypothetical protein